MSDEARIRQAIVKNAPPGVPQAPEHVAAWIVEAMAPLIAEARQEATSGHDPVILRGGLVLIAENSQDPWSSMAAKVALMGAKREANAP